MGIAATRLDTLLVDEDIRFAQLYPSPPLPPDMPRMRIYGATPTPCPSLPCNGDESRGHTSVGQLTLRLGAAIGLLSCAPLPQAFTAHFNFTPSCWYHAGIASRPHTATISYLRTPSSRDGEPPSKCCLCPYLAPLRLHRSRLPSTAPPPTVYHLSSTPLVNSLVPDTPHAPHSPMPMFAGAWR